MTHARDLVGQKFGRLTVVCLSARINKRRAYLCFCECGNKKVIRSECLTSGMTKSCGCLRNENTALIKKTHGLSNTPEYKSWAKAKSRVFNKNDAKYYCYGERGITMCKEWANSFKSFFADMGNKPSSEYSLGRIDVNKGYCKENCRWESIYEQARARTDNVFVFVDGKSMILKDACKEKNINYKQASLKLKKGTHTFEELCK